MLSKRGMARCGPGWAAQVVANSWRLAPVDVGAGRCRTCDGNEEDEAALKPHYKLHLRRPVMSGLIYLVGLVVVIMAILSFLGMH